jgi:hypothetical protein
MTSTRTKALFSAGFLILWVWRLPHASVHAQDACAGQAAWTRYTNCTVSIVNRGGADVSSCVAPTCALGDCGGGGGGQTILGNAGM